MTSAPSQATLQVIASLAEIDRRDWDACANPGWASDNPLSEPVTENDSRPAYNPFLCHDFLWSLEESGAAVAKTGWQGQHLVLADPDCAARAVMPCYLKSHSRGEYVFDAGWADAFYDAGGQYYPKLQCSIPFTPVIARKLLVKGGSSADRDRLLLAAGAVELNRRLGVSSLHFTFLPENERQLLAGRDFLMRTGRQFHFTSDGYRDFDDFLDALASRKRKAIRRERRDAVNGLSIERLTGSDLTEEVWDAFFRFYMDTGSRKWGRPYLNRQFYSLVNERMADRILLVMAKHDGEWVAGALNFIGSDTLYGRYWGTVIDQPFLHFELCYYQAIEWALAHGLTRVEAGAGGEHKLARGYEPVLTHSAHWIAHDGFRDAVERFLQQEGRHVAREREILSEHVPYRHGERQAMQAEEDIGGSAE